MPGCRDWKERGVDLSAKGNPLSERDGQLESNLLKWFEEQGYPLEMRVAQAFRDAGLSVWQPDHYTDPESGTIREIDVCAIHTLGFDSDSSDPFPVHISFCIECKRTKHPWILFAYGTDGYNPFSDEWYAGTDPYVANSEFRSIDLPAGNLFSDGGFVTETVGYGITEAFTSARDSAYAAVTVAAKCAIAKGQILERMNKAGRLSHKIGLAFPVVIVDARLFVAQLDQQNHINIQEIEAGIVFSSPLPYRERNECFAVRICTSRYLSTIAEQAVLIAKGVTVRQVFDEHRAKLRT